jgi:hypothetical protein
VGKYLDIIRRAEAAHKPPDDTPRVSSGPPSTFAHGSKITWEGPDGQQRGPAIVDFLHTDPDGSVWAFVTLGEGWAAVNLIYVRVEGS